jgi:hypothetical protein
VGQCDQNRSLAKSNPATNGVADYNSNLQPTAAANGNSRSTRRPFRVKNGPDAIEMGCLRHPRKQTSASAAAMTDPDPNPFADCDVIVCRAVGPSSLPSILPRRSTAAMTRLSDGWSDAGERSPQIEKVRLAPIHSALICACSVFENH